MAGIGNDGDSRGDAETAGATPRQPGDSRVTAGVTVAETSRTRAETARATAATRVW